MIINRKYLYFFITISLLFFNKPAIAENPVSYDTPWEKFNLNAGYFISNVDSDLALGSGLGLTVNVEDLLGLDSTNRYLE